MRRANRSRFVLARADARRTDISKSEDTLELLDGRRRRPLNATMDVVIHDQVHRHQARAHGPSKASNPYHATSRPLCTTTGEPFEALLVDSALADLAFRDEVVTPARRDLVSCQGFYIVLGPDDGVLLRTFGISCRISPLFMLSSPLNIILINYSTGSTPRRQQDLVKALAEPSD